MLFPLLPACTSCQCETHVVVYTVSEVVNDVPSQTDPGAVTVFADVKPEPRKWGRYSTETDTPG